MQEFLLRNIGAITARIAFIAYNKSAWHSVPDHKNIVILLTDKDNLKPILRLENSGIVYVDVIYYSKVRKTTNIQEVVKLPTR